MVGHLDPHLLASPNKIGAVTYNLADIACCLEAGLDEGGHFQALDVRIIHRPGEVEKHNI